MSRSRALVAVFAVASLMSAAIATQAAAAPAPAWTIQSVPTPTNFIPGDSTNDYRYEAVVGNGGSATTDGTPIVVTDTLPAGLVVDGVGLFIRATNGTAGARDYAAEACTTDTGGETSTVHCTVSSALPEATEPTQVRPGEQFRMVVHVQTPASTSGALQNSVTVTGGGAAPAAKSIGNEASSLPASPGFFDFGAKLVGEDGLEDLQGGSHPFAYTTSFAVNTRLGGTGKRFKFVPAEGNIKDVTVALPPGLIGNPIATQRCSRKQFSEITSIFPNGNVLAQANCPNGSAVGMVVLNQLEGQGQVSPYPLYNLVPPKGMPAQFGFQLNGAPIFINTKVRSGGDYGVTAYLSNTTQARPIMAATVTIWGTPADPSHDSLRGRCLDNTSTFSLGSCSSEEPSAKPFLRLPSICGTVMNTAMTFNIWPQPNLLSTRSQLSPALGGCSALPFTPSIEAKPTTNSADSPSGLRFDLHNPQPQDAEAPGEADLRDVTVTLPEGLTVNPSSADGLGACSEADIGYQGMKEGRPSFSGDPATCPDAAKLGSVTVKTPLVDHPLPGAVYLAKQGENPFDSLLAIYVTVSDPETGVVVKLAGHVQPDPNTGQLTTTVEQSPQLPFEDFELDFFKGARAPLRTPPTCGTHTTHTTLVPWSAPEGPTTHPASAFGISQSPGGCHSSAADLPASPSLFEAGTESPIAGATSPIVTKLSREDASQEFGKLILKPPPGLLASLAGIPYCPDSALGAAASKSGKDEQASASCPTASQVGTVTVGAGAGPTPFFAAGKAYLAGPYRGAPLSLAVITPAVAGPFDLGTVVVRVALHVDPATTQITAVSDPIPHILDGIPLDVRSIAVRLDHPGWGLNPTSCEPFSFDGTLQSALGGSASLHNRFQVGECARLGFKPTLNLSLEGKTERTAFPAFRAVYVPRKGDANLENLVLRFPHSEFIEQGHFRTICTRVQWAAGAGNGASCPKGSIYGQIKAITPLLDQPLEGPVYLRSSSHNLPDVVFSLRGQVTAEVAVRIDSVKGGLRASLEGAPDVPISKVILNMQGGPKGLFVNSRDICAHEYRATVSLSAHNGRAGDMRPAMRAKCGKRHGRGHGKKHRAKR